MTKKRIQSPPKKKTMTSRKLKSNIYEDDYFKWTRLQMDFLKNEEFDKLDRQHLMMEIESLGNSEKRALESHIANLFLHLLKIEYQPSKHSKSWDNSVKNAKFQILKLLKENPSLKSKLPLLAKDAYFSARLAASSETGLDEENFPASAPWEIKNLLY